MQSQISTSDGQVLRSLLEIGVNLSVVADRHRLLDMILQEARKLARAEAGSLCVMREEQLRFAAAQNDRLEMPEIVRSLLDRELPVSTDSLAGFVATTGRTLNIPDSFAMGDGTPFRINRDFDASTGYRTQSILAIPLKCPDGEVVGVLELINCLDADGRVVPFAAAADSGLVSMGAMAAVTIHNFLLQEKLRDAHLNTIIRLSIAAELRDDATGEHVRRISRTSRLVAEAAGLAREKCELIQWASPMHDIGKIGVPDSILRKPGPLTAEERCTMQEHAAIGAQILDDPGNDLIAMARDIALSHHEWWNGQGYPQGLSGRQIPVTARIVGIVDVFDALVSERCYKKAYPSESAVGLINEACGTQFDPDVVDAFNHALPAILECYRSAAPAIG